MHMPGPWDDDTSRVYTWTYDSNQAQGPIDTPMTHCLVTNSVFTLPAGVQVQVLKLKLDKWILGAPEQQNVSYLYA